MAKSKTQVSKDKIRFVLPIIKKKRPKFNKKLSLKVANTNNRKTEPVIENRHTDVNKTFHLEIRSMKNNQISVKHKNDDKDISKVYGSIGSHSYNISLKVKSEQLTFMSDASQVCDSVRDVIFHASI